VQHGLVRRVFDELGHAEPSVRQTSGFALDEGQSGVAHDDVF
jgi:hypothetical protein